MNQGPFFDAPLHERVAIKQSLDSQVQKSKREYSDITNYVTNMKQERDHLDAVYFTRDTFRTDPKKEPTAQEKEIILDLDILARNLQEKIQLEEEIFLLLKNKSSNYIQKESLEDGDEWKNDTEHQEKKRVTVFELEPKNIIDAESIESMKERIAQIDTVLEKTVADIQNNHPAIFEIIQEKAKRLAEKNHPN